MLENHHAAGNTGLIESNDARVEQVGSSEFVPDSVASGGGYLVSNRVTGRQSNHDLTLSFEGTTISTGYYQLPVAYHFTIVIDEVPVRTIITSTSPIPMPAETTIDYLSRGPHVIRIVVSGTGVAIDRFYIPDQR